MPDITAGCLEYHRYRRTFPWKQYFELKGLESDQAEDIFWVGSAGPTGRKHGSPLFWAG